MSPYSFSMANSIQSTRRTHYCTISKLNINKNGMEQLIAHFLCTNTIALSEVAFSNLHLLSLLSEKNDCHPIFLI